MSFDFRFRKTCDHRVIRERIFLRGDKQTAFLARPIRALNSLQLRVNGVIIDKDHEEFGYNLYTDVITRRLLVSATQPLLLKSGQLYELRESDVEIDTLVITDLFSPNVRYDLSNLDIALNINGKYTVTSSSISVIPENTWINLSYDFSADYYKFDTSEQHRIFFNKSIYQEYYIDVSYSTDIYNCRQCHGIGILNDFNINSIGSCSIVRGSEKLEQDCYIYSFTVKGTDPYYRNLGTGLLRLIGTGNMGEVTKNSIKAELRDSLDLYRRVQGEQYQLQDVTLDETLDYVENIEVEQDEGDPTLLHVSVRIRTLSQRVVTVAGEVSPEVVV